MPKPRWEVVGIEELTRTSSRNVFCNALCNAPIGAARQQCAEVVRMRVGERKSGAKAMVHDLWWEEQAEQHKEDAKALDGADFGMNITWNKVGALQITIPKAGPLNGGHHLGAVTLYFYLC